MSPTYYPPKPLEEVGLTSDFTRLVTTLLTILRCYTCNDYSLKSTDISNDFKDTIITILTKSSNFSLTQKIRVESITFLFENNVVINTYKI